MQARQDTWHIFQEPGPAKNGAPRWLLVTDQACQCRTQVRGAICKKKGVPLAAEVGGGAGGGGRGGLLWWGRKSIWEISRPILPWKRK